MVRLGQNFLADTNLLDAIVRDAELGHDDVVLEIGGGEGALTERMAPRVAQVHVIEIGSRTGRCGSRGRTGGGRGRRALREGD